MSQPVPDPVDDIAPSTDRAADDSDHGWGDDAADPDGSRDDERFTSERPPHW